MFNNLFHPLVSIRWVLVLPFIRIKMFILISQMIYLRDMFIGIVLMESLGSLYFS